MFGWKGGVKRKKGVQEFGKKPRIQERNPKEKKKEGLGEGERKKKNIFIGANKIDINGTPAAHLRTMILNNVRCNMKVFQYGQCSVY